MSYWVTGRATDSTLFLSPLMYEFGWRENVWGNLARGILACIFLVIFSHVLI